ncbi:MAG TPA: tail fiber domain-containing protein, partial [Verrucomicrobiae bacterium]|nr:tail fiber domain-containing protein [Verrucomicrobiae bacterium]
YSVIAGGQANSIGSNSPNATIGGGYQNIMVTNDPFSTISGGVSNKITAYNFIIGSMTAATIAGGFQNIISNQASFASIGGGQQNSCAGGFGTVGGGFQNSTQGGNDTIAGGYQNATTPNAATSTIGGGMQNFIDQAESTISGGYRNTNTVTAVASVIGGGQNNLITNSTATISGGRFNIAGGLDSVVPGGDLNSAMGRSSYASGFRAKATNDGAFVWADLQNSDFSSTLDNSVSFRCANGVKFSNGASSGANVAVSWSPGTGAWVFSSDRSLKEGFETVDALTILDKVTQLPISEWNYKGYSQRHIGVMAQDFHAAFPLNESTTTLNDADLHGVALAAIQGLNEKLTEELKRRDVENEQLKQEVDELKVMMEKLNQKINGGGN